MSMCRSILRKKKRNTGKIPSPFTRGTTLNKFSNMIISVMQVTGKSFSDILNHDETRRMIATHNNGEFRKYPPKGPGSFNELLKLAVGRKLRIVIR